MKTQKNPSPAKMATPSSKVCKNLSLKRIFFHFLEAIPPVWVVPAQQRTKKSLLQTASCTHPKP